MKQNHSILSRFHESNKLTVLKVIGTFQICGNIYSVKNKNPCNLNELIDVVAYSIEDRT